MAAMMAAIGEERSEFTISRVLKDVSDKLVRRHPHVFSDTEVKDSEEVIKNWEHIKATQEGKNHSSMLDSVPASFPPLQMAYKVQKKMSRNGLDWENPQGAWDKFYEEIEEFKVESDEKKKEEEMGDLLFSVINLARLHHIDPSVALMKTVRKVSSRVRYVEEKMGEASLPMNQETLPQMDEFWEEAKGLDKGN